MDLQNIKEFHCAVCFELFGENLSSPRMLACGHSFCHSCLEDILVQSPSCPNCKQEILFPNVDCIPVNYNIKSIVSRFNVDISVSINEQNTVLNAGDCKLKTELRKEHEVSLAFKKDLRSKEFPHEGYCEDHQAYNRFRCMDCSSWVCGDCVALNHKPCRTLVVAEALKELKQEISRKVDAEINVQNKQKRILDIFLNDLKEKRLSLKKEIKKIQLDLRNKIESLKSYGKCIEKLQFLKSNRNIQCNKLKALDNSIEKSVNNDQFTESNNMLNKFLIQAQKFVEELTIPRQYHHNLSLKILRDWCQVGTVYSSHCQNGTNQYGKVEVKGDRVWVHCFMSQRPKRDDVIISFRELLISFGGSTVFPRRGFLQVDDETSGLSDVVIATDALTPRAMNFLLLCSGIKGRSYEGDSLDYNGWSIETSFHARAVVKGISDGGAYGALSKKGFVYGEWAKNRNLLSGFDITMEDEPKVRLLTKFGFVEEGIKICKRIYSNKKDVAIKNCGLVI